MFRLLTTDLLLTDCCSGPPTAGGGIGVYGQLRGRSLNGSPLKNTGRLGPLFQKRAQEGMNRSGLLADPGWATSELRGKAEEADI